MYFQRSGIVAIQKPTKSVVGVGVATVKPRAQRARAPRAIDTVTGVNVVVGTVAVALAVDTLVVFWKKYRREQDEREPEED